MRNKNCRSPPRTILIAHKLRVIWTSRDPPLPLALWLGRAEIELFSSSSVFFPLPLPCNRQRAGKLIDDSGDGQLSSCTCAPRPRFDLLFFFFFFPPFSPHFHSIRRLEGKERKQPESRSSPSSPATAIAPHARFFFPPFFPPPLPPSPVYFEHHL